MQIAGVDEGIMAEPDDGFLPLEAIYYIRQNPQRTLSPGIGRSIGFCIRQSLNGPLQGIGHHLTGELSDHSPLVPYDPLIAIYPLRSRTEVVSRIGSGSIQLHPFHELQVGTTREDPFHHPGINDPLHHGHPVWLPSFQSGDDSLSRIHLLPFPLKYLAYLHVDSLDKTESAISNDLSIQERLRQ